MRKFENLYLILAAVAGLAFAETQNANAQWWRISNGRTCQRCANGNCYFQTKVTAAPAVKQEAAAPCEAVEKVEHEAVGACEAVEKIDAEPIPACGAVTVCEESTCVCGAACKCKRRPIRQAAAVAFRLELARINAARARYGRRALVYDANLERVAVANCNLMARYNQLGHFYGGWEICAYNYNGGIDGAINQWTWSRAHANILFGNFTRCGVARVTSANGVTWYAVRFQ